MYILIVEDEQILCKQIAQFLESKGFAVKTAFTGEEGYYIATNYSLDLAILDVGLPDFSGIELVKRLRKQKITVPVLFLSALSQLEDRTDGLDAGADYYLVKPFHYEELLATVNALIRRAAGQSNPELRYDNVVLNTLIKEVRVSDAPTFFTADEYKTLEYLMMHQGETVSKGDLRAHARGDDCDCDSDVVETLIYRIRKKIDPDKTRKQIITRKGIGYTMPSQVLNHYNIELNVVTHEVSVSGAKVLSTDDEYIILHYLILHCGEIVSKTKLRTLVRGDDSDVVVTIINSIQKKIDPEGTRGQIITHEGLGYIILK